uniref:hypothetical protein n=1 Tax=Porodaedalea mongolica TaxID=2651638 RepID=UPI0021ACA4A4|nr:hypothetical protein NYK79_mgp03 [Porodaedalea mongolica]UUA03987.1 hypothetical protein [Porodaedalea mongolica]WCF76691.1 hypothetical protein [Porodaedalea mongolica]
MEGVILIVVGTPFGPWSWKEGFKGSLRETYKNSLPDYSKPFTWLDLDTVKTIVICLGVVTIGYCTWLYWPIISSNVVAASIAVNEWVLTPCYNWASKTCSYVYNNLFSSRDPPAGWG